MGETAGRVRLDSSGRTGALVELDLVGCLGFAVSAVGLEVEGAGEAGVGDDGDVVWSPAGS